MKKTFLRLSIAALLSLSVYALTEWWYQKNTAVLSNSNNSLALAFVENIKSNVDRRPVSKLIWQNLNEGDPVYNNETIKTSGQSSVRIMFADGSRYIDLEPESLITITQSKNSIALDLLDGSFLITQNEAVKKTSGNQLKIKSGDKTIDLTFATAQLHKTADEQIDMKLLKGKSQIDDNGKKQELKAGQSLSSIEILQPSPNKIILLENGSTEPVQFSWKALAPNSQVTLWIGHDKKNIRAVQRTQTAQETSLSISLKPGVYYYKLVSSTNLETAVYRLQVKQNQAPVEDIKINLSWNHNKTNSTQFFVNQAEAKWYWEDPKSEKIKKWRIRIQTHDTNSEGRSPAAKPEVHVFESMQAEITTPLPSAGSYAALIEALDENNNVLSTSEVKTIEVAVQPKLKAPEFTPKDGALQAQNNGELHLNWLRTEGAIEYWLILSDNNGKELRRAKFQSLRTSLSNLLPGEYQVSLYAVDQYGRESERLPARKVLVPESSALDAPKLRRIQVN